MVGLPATRKLREEFDPDSGLDHKGKGHYPQCLVSTVFDVFRRLPIARTVMGIHSSERQQARALLPHIPPGNVLLFDRGYPSYELILHLREHYDGHFVFRCQSASTFPAVEAFVKSNRKEGFVVITPSNNFLQKHDVPLRKRARLIQLRIIRLDHADGTCSVLLTSLLNSRQFPTREIVDLYFWRWAIESQYRDEKMVLEIERFHGKTANAIRQELFASMIMTVIARTLMAVSTPPAVVDSPQFKHAMMTLASEMAVLVPQDPEVAVKIFREMLVEIARVRYYRAKKPRASQPRVTKAPQNKWCVGKSKKLEIS